MSIESLTENHDAPDQQDFDRARAKSGNWLIWLQLLALAVGLGLFIYVMYQFSFKTITDALQRIGWGILIIIGLNGTRHLLRASCLYLAIPPERRQVKFRSVVAARLGGEAVGFLTFAGPFIGEATKAGLLKNQVSLTQSVAAVLVDNILYYFSVIAIILSGIALMLAVYGSGSAIVSIVFVAISLLSVLFVVGIALLAAYRFKPFSWLIKFYSGRKWFPQFVAARKTRILEIENAVLEFYLHRPTTFFLLLGLNFFAHILSVCEVYLALLLLHFAPSWTAAYIIESLTKIINFSFSFVPATIGVYEVGNQLILRTLGYAEITGVTLALVRRGGMLFWMFAGLLLLLRRGISHGKQKIKRNRNKV